LALVGNCRRLYAPYIRYGRPSAPTKLDPGPPFRSALIFSADFTMNSGGIACIAPTTARASHFPKAGFDAFRASRNGTGIFNVTVHANTGSGFPLFGMRVTSAGPYRFR